ncbi:MAG: ribonuclease E/G [Pseudomonadota bacterium]
MVKRLLIDATHNEEVRVAVVNTHSLEEFDSETANKRLTKSNIYLARVVRVEPSLQAAFVEYNNGRHGFLPFAEIHPDYYRIPVADRKMLEQSLALQAAEANGELSGDDALESNVAEDESTKTVSESTGFESNGFSELIDDKNQESPEESANQNVSEDEESADVDESLLADRRDQTTDIGGDYAVGADDLLEPEAIANNEKRNLRFRYKIQEVIKRRQIMLVQVVKEERGNKGAALTTYLSLPGRYCVLMPNAGHRAGGVSRKISDNDDRRRLRSLMKEFEIPEGMSLIVRTAGQERNKSEIKRDYEYLLRVWDDIREKTIISTAPDLVYAEGDLVKRAIRDIYDRDIEEVLVEGEEAYKAAKNFMKSLIPSHAKKVKLYKDLLQPIFHRFGVEEQIEKMHQPVVTLPSGGSIVINHTEALVAIDVNSGKSTRERNIDDTAVKTNLEAAAEIGRQLRLRDIGGIVVIDFIDMHDSGHIANVERKVRDALKSDRARIQVGRISQFGLLELSRQRLRPSMLESHSMPCTHCSGTGLVRSVDSLALQALREIERTVISGNAYEVLVTVPLGVDLFLLNQKRNAIVAIENRYGVVIQIIHDTTMLSPNFVVEVLSERPRTLKIAASTVNYDEVQQPSVDDSDDEESEDTDTDQETTDDASRLKKKSRRHNNRRRRNNRRDQGEAGAELAEGSTSDETTSTESIANESESTEQNTTTNRSPRRPIHRHEKRAVTEDTVAASDAIQPSESASEETPSEEGQTEKRFTNNRRRRHPYQRRQHNKTYDNKADGVSERPPFEPKIIEPRLIDGTTPTAAPSVIPMKREASRGQQAPRPPRESGKVEGADSAAAVAPAKKKEPKQSKSWLRRLLDN